MEHLEAIRENFAERYLLSELTPAQRDLFEDHFFDCPICSADMYAGAVFIDNAREVLKAEETFEPAPRPQAKFGAPFQSAAILSVCLLGVLGYENIVALPNRPSAAVAGSPEVPQRLSLLEMGSRAEMATRVVDASKNTDLELEVPGSANFTDYELKIMRSGNQVGKALPVSSEQIKNAVLLSLPARSLSPGQYKIVATGKKPDGSGRELTEYPITVK